MSASRHQEVDEDAANLTFNQGSFAIYPRACAERPIRPCLFALSNTTVASREHCGAVAQPLTNPWLPWLPPDIEDEQCVPLFLSEVEMLLKERMKKQVDQEGEMSEMFRSTLDYCQRFGQFKNTQTAASVRR